MGAGWEKGTVVHWEKLHGAPKPWKQTVVCHDSRNLEVL